MALDFVKGVLNEKFEIMGRGHFVGYCPVGTFAKGRMTKRSDHDVMFLTIPEYFKGASAKLGQVFDPVNPFYFIDKKNSIDGLLGVPVDTGTYSVTPEAVRSLGGEVFCDWGKPVTLKEGLEISPVVRTIPHVLWYFDVNLNERAGEINKWREFRERAKFDIVGGLHDELLIYTQGSFDDVVKRVATGEPIIHDSHGRSAEELRKIPRFRDDYIIITDPTDPNRNSFGIVTNKTRFMWDKLSYSSRVFLETGKVEPRPLPEGYNYAVVEDASRFSDNNRKFTWLFGTGNKGRNLLKNEGYEAEVVDVDVESSRVFLNLKDVSSVFPHMGPEKKNGVACKAFEEKHKDEEIVEKEGRLYVQKERPGVEVVLSNNGFEVIRCLRDYDFILNDEVRNHIERHFQEKKTGSVFLREAFPNVQTLIDFAFKRIENSYTGKQETFQAEMPYVVGLNAVYHVSELPEGAKIEEFDREGFTVKVVHGLERKPTKNIVMEVGPLDKFGLPGKHSFYTIYPGIHLPLDLNDEVWKDYVFAIEE